MIDILTIEPDLSSVRSARRFISGHIGGLDQRLVENVTLMVSELVTNAIRHGLGGGTLTLEVTDQSLRVDVTDQSTGIPILRSPAFNESSGRGLRIVAELSDDWGIESLPGSGNTVWFCVDLHTSRVGEFRNSASQSGDVSSPPASHRALPAQAHTPPTSSGKRRPGEPQASAGSFISPTAFVPVFAERDTWVLPAYDDLIRRSVQRRFPSASRHERTHSGRRRSDAGYHARSI